MENVKSVTYESPRLVIIEVDAEKGFAASGDEQNLNPNSIDW